MRVLIHLVAVVCPLEVSFILCSQIYFFMASVFLVKVRETLPVSYFSVPLGTFVISLFFCLHLGAFGVSSRTAVPNLFGPRDQFHGRQFSHIPWVVGAQQEWFWDDSNALRLLCTLFLLLLHCNM